MNTEQIVSHLASTIPDFDAQLCAALWELWPQGEPGPRYKGPRPRSPSELMQLLELHDVETEEDGSIRLYYLFKPGLGGDADSLFTLEVRNGRVDAYARDS